MSRKQRQSMIDREHRKVSLTRQCTLLDISRAWLYYQPTTPSAEDLELGHVPSSGVRVRHPVDVV